MAATTAYHPDRAAASRQPWILFDSFADIDDRRNGTTVQASTSNKKTIQVSIWPAAPPAPSRLAVHCPDLQGDVFREVPRILCSADDLLLIRVDIGCPAVAPWERGDYFIYRILWGELPLLQLLPKPGPFHDDEVGLLPRGDHFTVAALSFAMHGHNLHLFSSETWSWACFSDVPVAAPQRPFPIQIHRDSARLHHHCTSTVITLGGGGGTMGWVDLWRGILFCDVLSSSSPQLRGVPVPLPGPLLKHGKRIEGCPKSYRGIAVVNGSLKMVEMEARASGAAYPDSETGHLNFRVDDWELSTYTNSRITGAWEDWELDAEFRASSAMIDGAMRWKLLHCGLLHDAGGGTQRELQNLHTSQPALSLDGEGVVYLLARAKYMQSKAWVLAVNMAENKIQALAGFGTDRSMGLSLAYCPSRISSYVDM
ncbi:hypothetical protein ACP70R_031653 [Stipagrostis hirtigluma subsp. patula]